jgi:hypothetical protein
MCYYLLRDYFCSASSVDPRTIQYTYFIVNLIISFETESNPCTSTSHLSFQIVIYGLCIPFYTLSSACYCEYGFLYCVLHLVKQYLLYEIYIDLTARNDVLIDNKIFAFYSIYFYSSSIVFLGIFQYKKSRTHIRR